MLLPLFDKLDARSAVALRLAGLAGLIFWQFRESDHPALHGRGLVVALLLLLAALSWLPWSLNNRGYDLLHSRAQLDVLVMAACGGGLVGISPDGASNVFLFAAAFTAGARLGLPLAFTTTAAGMVAVTISWSIYQGNLVGDLAYCLGLMATTYGGNQRHEALVRREQAELLLAQTQRSQEEALRNARLEESSRIAREIHDVLAHSLAGLTIQLEATAALIEAGAGADTILPRVRRAHELARDGLRETRLAVGALRGDSSAAAPALARIDALVADFRASGAELEVEVDADAATMGSAVGDAAVRIIQEALTNVVKHAPGSAVRLEIGSGPPVRVAVANRSPAPVVAGVGRVGGLGSSGGGYGLIGMRERVLELGGSLSAGPTPEGWLVSAVLGEQRP